MSTRTFSYDLARFIPFRDAAVAQGMASWKGTDVDPRAAYFYAATAQFGESEWLIVAKRKLKAGRKFQSAKRLVSEVLPLIEKSDLVQTEQFRTMLHATWKVRNLAVESARSMPSQVVSDGQEIGLLSGANDAIIAVSFCLAIHDWLMLTPQGVKAARCDALVEWQPPLRRQSAFDEEKRQFDYRLWKES